MRVAYAQAFTDQDKSLMRPVADPKKAGKFNALNETTIRGIQTGLPYTGLPQISFQ